MWWEVLQREKGNSHFCSEPSRGFWVVLWLVTEARFGHRGAVLLWHISPTDVSADSCLHSVIGSLAFSQGFGSSPGPWPGASVQQARSSRDTGMCACHRCHRGEGWPELQERPSHRVWTDGPSCPILGVWALCQAIPVLSEKLGPAFRNPDFCSGLWLDKSLGRSDAGNSNNETHLLSAHPSNPVHRAL